LKFQAQFAKAELPSMQHREIEKPLESALLMLDISHQKAINVFIFRD
jgi:hypothetical protein